MDVLMFVAAVYHKTNNNTPHRIPRMMTVLYWLTIPASLYAIHWNIPLAFFCMFCRKLLIKLWFYIQNTEVKLNILMLFEIINGNKCLKMFEFHIIHVAQEDVRDNLTIII